MNLTDTLNMSFMLIACELIHIFAYIEATAVIVLKILGTIMQDLVTGAICAKDLCTPAEENIIYTSFKCCVYISVKNVSP